jgi:nickel transport protein
VDDLPVPAPKTMTLLPPRRQPRGRSGPWPGNLALQPLISAGLVLTGSAPASAHALESSLQRLETLRNGLILESRFSTGQPATGAIVRLVPPDGGTPVEVGRMDTDGRLGFHLPSQANGSWELQVDGGPGHRDYLELPVHQGRVEIDQVSDRNPGRDLLESPYLLSGLLLGVMGSLAGLVAGIGGVRRRP